MKKTIFLLVLTIVLIVNTFGQNTLELTFSAVDNTDYVQLDRIKVLNRTQNCDTTLYWPDTTLTLDYQVGIVETNSNIGKLKVYQNFPNPVKQQTTITLYLAKKGEVNLLICNYLGQQIIKRQRILNKGYHSFRFTPGKGGIFFFIASLNEAYSSVKILSSGNSATLKSSLEYIDSNNSYGAVKVSETVQDFLYNYGDELRCIGYSDNNQSNIFVTPYENETYIFQFATDIPCPETPIVDYGGQIYNTVQVFNQCWLKENLNYEIGSSTCYENINANCISHGRLYDWNTMMNGKSSSNSVPSGVQGICPPGWHIPSDEEWKILEMGLGMTQNQADSSGWRGDDEGNILKSTLGWIPGGIGINAVGFSAVAGGFRFLSGSGAYTGLNTWGYWWSATDISTVTAWSRTLSYNHNDINRPFGYSKAMNFSVRCLRN